MTIDWIDINRYINSRRIVTLGANKNARHSKYMIKPTRAAIDRAKQWRLQCGVVSP